MILTTGSLFAGETSITKLNIANIDSKTSLDGANVDIFDNHHNLVNQSTVVCKDDLCNINFDLNKKLNTKTYEIVVKKNNDLMGMSDIRFIPQASNLSQPIVKLNAYATGKYLLQEIAKSQNKTLDEISELIKKETNSQEYKYDTIYEFIYYYYIDNNSIQGILPTNFNPVQLSFSNLRSLSSNKLNAQNIDIYLDLQTQVYAGCISTGDGITHGLGILGGVAAIFAGAFTGNPFAVIGGGALMWSNIGNLIDKGTSECPLSLNDIDNKLDEIIQKLDDMDVKLDEIIEKLDKLYNYNIDVNLKNDLDSIQTSLRKM